MSNASVRKQVDERVSAALAEAGVAAPRAIVQPASKPEFGHYQANGVMAAAKQMGEKPRDLAERTVGHLNTAGMIDRVEVAGPGFLNIWLSDACLESLLSDEDPALQPAAQAETVVVDYSSPNLAKEMHVGHLRSTIIGDAVVRMLSALGHDVIRQNHVGDWGTQFGMLVAYLAEADTQGGAIADELADLEVFYRASKQRFDTDPAFADRARDTVVKLQSGDEEVRAMWSRFIDVSLSHCDAVYARLGTLLTRDDVHAESAYNDDLAATVAALDAAGLLTESDGALCVFLDEFKRKDGEPLPVIVQKSGGGFLYATTDLAAIRHRLGTLGAARVLYLVDARQSLHFEQVFAVARAAGFVPDGVVLQHLPFGTMLGADGRPFQTRAGGVVKLSDLLDEAEKRALDVVLEKNPDLDAARRAEIASVVGIGAVKYADLSKNRTSDYVFDWEQMLSFDGNTAPYLQYAYTRIRSVFRRAEVDPDNAGGAIALNDPAERQLVVTLVRFQEVVEQAAAEGSPHLLCLYLFSLAQQFSRFYEACPILTAEADVRDSRLTLCRRTQTVLSGGLALLGIRTVEEM